MKDDLIQIQLNDDDLCRQLVAAMEGRPVPVAFGTAAHLCATQFAEGCGIPLPVALCRLCATALTMLRDSPTDEILALVRYALETYRQEGAHGPDAN